jgi:hypothetical protein
LRNSAGWLKEQPLKGRVGVCCDIAEALRYVVRDADGGRRASRRREAPQRLRWACGAVSVLFSEAADATLFKLARA